MLILAVVISVLLGWLGRGRLRNFTNARLCCLWLPACALLLQRFYLRPASLLVSYALLFLFLWLNRHLWISALLCGAGSACNLLVIALNNFRMPVAQSVLCHLTPKVAAELAGGEVPMYALETASTRVRFLGDILFVDVPLLGGFASIGDLMLALGVFCLMMSVMKPPLLRGLWMRGKYQM